MYKLTMLFAVAALFCAAPTSADCGDCCEHCGCQAQCRKVCRVVCDKKKVPKITYTCECEDFCIPGPSKICGYKCECESDCCGEHCKKVPNYVPTCAKVHTRKKLVKHEEIKEVPTYKWVVETVCDRCACQAAACASPATAAGETAEEASLATAQDTSDAVAMPSPPTAMMEGQAGDTGIKSQLRKALNPLFGK